MSDSKSKKQPESIPLYVNTYDKLFEMLQNEAPGTRLPSEEDLAKQLNVSRNTLRQALQILQEDRVIYKRRGSGTYVSKKPSYLDDKIFNRYHTIPDYLNLFELNLRLESIRVTLESSDKITSELLQLPLHSPVLVVNRIYSNRKDKNVVYAQLLDFIPHVLVKDRVDDLFSPETLIREVEAHGAMAQTEIIPTLAGKLNAEVMHLTENSPLLLLQQVVMNAVGEPLYLNKTYLNCQTNEFSLIINRN